MYGIPWHLGSKQTTVHGVPLNTMDSAPREVVHIHLDRVCMYQEIPRGFRDHVMTQRWASLARGMIQDAQLHARQSETPSAGISPGGAQTARLFTLVINSIMLQNED